MNEGEYLTDMCPGTFLVLPLLRHSSSAPNRHQQWLHDEHDEHGQWQWQLRHVQVFITVWFELSWLHKRRWPTLAAQWVRQQDGSSWGHGEVRQRTDGPSDGSTSTLHLCHYLQLHPSHSNTLIHNHHHHHILTASVFHHHYHHHHSLNPHISHPASKFTSGMSLDLSRFNYDTFLATSKGFICKLMALFTCLNK